MVPYLGNIYEFVETFSIQTIAVVKVLLLCIRIGSFYDLMQIALPEVTYDIMLSIFFEAILFCKVNISGVVLRTSIVTH